MKNEKSLSSRLFRTMAWTAILILAATLAILIPTLSHSFTTSRRDYLNETTAIVRRALNENPTDRMDYLKKAGKTSKLRMTWIAKSGKVLYDNEADVSTMENHKNRPEVRAAMKSGKGTSSRFSKTLSESTDYCAM